MSKKWVSLMMAVTILLSGVCAFGGTYFANTINGRYSQINNGLDNISQLSEIFGGTKQEGLSIAAITELTAQSVVEISTETLAMGRRIGQYVTEGAGSGVIVSADGYIVTNNHVVDGANKISVRLKNGEVYEAVLIGKDRKTDTAVVKIEAKSLVPAVYGDSDALTVGELAVAVGNPLGELGGTVTEGIISALNRDIVIDGESMNLLQTSAAINPGNSGGGLFNARGELIGIVNAKSSGSDIEGLGFAIPVNTVSSVVEQIIAHGYVQGRVELGATLIDISDSISAIMYRVPSTGVYVAKVADEQSELKSGDKIVSINGKGIKLSEDVKAIIEEYKVGEVLNFVVMRGNSEKELKVTLIESKN